MLANLLPGLRHVRAPLIAGYLYFLFVWLLLGDRLLPDPSDESSVGRVGRFAELIGPTGTLASVSVAAYLLGSTVLIQQSFLGSSVVKWSEHGAYFPDWADGLRAWVDSVVDRVGERLTYADLVDDASLPSPFVSHLEGAWRAERRRRLDDAVETREQLDRYAKSTNGKDPIFDAARAQFIENELPYMTQRIADLQVPEEVIAASHRGELDHPWFEIDGHRSTRISGAFIYEVLMDQAQEELERVTARLRVESDTVFNEYDRARSESELRYTIVPPLVLVVGVLTFTWHWAAIIGLIIPLVLYRHARRTERKAVGIVIDALRYGIVQSPTEQALVAIAERRTQR